MSAYTVATGSNLNGFSISTFATSPSFVISSTPSFGGPSTPAFSSTFGQNLHLGQHVCLPLGLPILQPLGLQFLVNQLHHLVDSLEVVGMDLE
jgi:hypothetical protein